MPDDKFNWRLWSGEVLARLFIGAARKRLNPRRNALLARILARTAALFLPNERTRLLENLKTAFPHGTPFRTAGFFHKVLTNFLRAGLDTIYASWDWPHRAQELFDMAQVNGALAAVEDVHRSNKRCILVSAHIGSWELAAAVLATRFDLRPVARRIFHEPFQYLVTELRRRLGYSVFLQEDPVTTMAKHVKSGGLLGLVADQDIKHNAGVFVPFFGKDAFTPVGPAALAILTGAPILPFFCVYDGGRYRIELGKVVSPPAKRSEGSVKALTAAWQNEVENIVRRYPDQWAWFHRRWKTRPGDVEEAAL